MKKLTPDMLKVQCNPASFNFTTTAELTPRDAEIIGQERAVNAMEFGLKIRQKGYNIFMAGPTGTGKTTYAKTIVKAKAKDAPNPADWCYIYNINDPETPKAITLPAGIGIKLKTDMDKFVTELKNNITKAFESDGYEKQAAQIEEKYQEKSDNLLAEYEEEIRKEGFVLQKSGTGLVSIPIKDDHPLTHEDFENMNEEEKNDFMERSKHVQAQMDNIIRKVRKWENQANKELEKFDQKIGISVTKPLINQLREEYHDYPVIVEYLTAIQEDILKNLNMFKEEEVGDNPFMLPVVKDSEEDDFCRRYQVNLLVNNKDTSGAPVIIETNPTYYNIFGKIEGKSLLGNVVTDFTMIKAGAIHKANGGYLILQAKDVLSNPYSWETLIRTLSNQHIQIENIGEQLSSLPISTLKPEPIPLDVKIILIGSPDIHQILYEYDEDFRKFFKIVAHFDVEMENSEGNVGKFTTFISNMCHREGLKHFTAKAVASVIEYSNRLADNQQKLTTRFNDIVEILYEAHTWAEIDNAEVVDEKHVRKAVLEKTYRSGLEEEYIQEMIEKDHILIAVAGEEIGQINGLAVYHMGEYSFGKPSRITARTYLGKQGVMNIEREAHLSGNIHDKAVLILTGYLGGKYAQDKPLTLSASLAFEQNYGGIDGDSASCAELIALLSSISGLPIRQDMAITGSMNQMGKVQPIGGVNEKVEGFFKVCKAKGLTGTQGVAIPYQNVENLMLDTEIINAVGEGKFHIYAVSEIDEAIELMMNKPGSEVHATADARLRALSELAQAQNQKKD